MPRATTRIIAILTVSLFSGSLALAQQTSTPEPVQETASIPAFDLHEDWAKASAIASSKHKLIIATSADPTHRHACRVQSFTPDQLVCKGSFGKTNAYKPQEIAALITPGDKDFKLRGVLVVNGVAAAAIWGTVVLAATCIPCAVATGVAALFILGAAGAILIADDQPEAILYLAPGQTLQVKLH
jgi:hypothetical protein